MSRSRWSLQLVVLGPVLAVMIAAGGALYVLVLRSVGEFADASVRANLDALARGAFLIADAEVDRQHSEGKAGDERAAALYQLNARMRFEDFAREHGVGLIVDVGGVAEFATGVTAPDVQAIVHRAPATGAMRLALSAGRETYVRPVAFAPWNWRLVLVKDATAFEHLVAEVRTISIGSAAAVLVIASMLVIWLRQVLVRPIYRIAQEFGEGRAPDYRGVSELEFLSESIRRMMDALRANTLHLETTLQSMSDGIAVFDADMRLVAWNEQYVRLYRYPRDLVRSGASFAEIMRHNVGRGDYGPGDPGAQLAEIVERARTLNPRRFEIDRADGTSMEVRRAPMPDGGFVTTYSDITDRKQAARMEIASEAKSRFLENMSHDLRKPITAIIEDVRLLLERSGDGLGADRLRNLERIQISATHLLGMVDALLEMSRIEAGQVDVRLEEVDVETLVLRAVRVVEPMAAASPVEVQTRIEDGLSLTTDPRLLSRIVMNLVGNAAEYTREGSIVVSARRAGAHVEVEVADTGVGIPEEKLALIFEKFQQVHPSAGLKKPGVGLGLGLAISREFARLLGGTIAVRSALGQGSVFTVSVPIGLSGAHE